MIYTYDELIVSDLHKDAYGYRPREWFWEQWDAYSDDDKKIVWDNLLHSSRSDPADEEDLTHHD